MTTSLDMIRGRSNVVTMTNNSGGALIAGDVCIQDATADENVTTTTSAASTSKVFIAAESIGIGAAGKFYESGYCPFVNVSASATRGYFLFTHTVAKQATSASSYGAGAFGRVLKAGTTPSAIIYSATAQVSGGGVLRSGSTTDGNLAVWNGSSADSIKDGGVALVDGTWTNYSATSTIVGWGSFTDKFIFYKQIGKTVFCSFRLSGTSDNVNATFTLPTTSASGVASLVLIRAINNSGSAAVGMAVLGASDNVVTCYSDLAGNLWTASNTKLTQGQVWYAIP